MTNALLSARLFRTVCMLSLSLVVFSSARGNEPAGESLTIAEINIGPDLADDTNGAITLRGADDRKQLIVTAKMRDGRNIDYTRDVTWTIEPPTLARVLGDGLILPLDNGNGKLTIRTTLGVQAERPITVSGMDTIQPVNFKHEIVPIFSKLGCNGGGCHGKASGQNGFKLSLLGFYPEDDYEYLVYESRSRRLSPAAPGESLLLTKGSGQVPHGGGSPLKPDSDEYRLLYRWIAQGMPYGSDSDPVLTGIECFPKQRIMGTDVNQQVTVIATYSDGHTKDVTRTALFEPNVAEMAEVTPTGLVTTGQLSGEVAIMARYQGYVDTFRSTIPLGANTQSIPAPANLIDEAVFSKLKQLGIPPSAPATDETFLRRVYVDITGTLPTAEEAKAFVADTNPNKRSELIDRLLDTPEYADLFTNKWSLLLRNRKQRPEDLYGVYAFYQWIWNSIYENKPYDEMVSQIITASGSIDQNPPVTWYREVTDAESLTEDCAQLFLGVRIQCARCHHHPFEEWSQDDYYGMAAFFSRIGKKTQAGNVNAKGRDRRVFHNFGTATAKNPKSGEAMKPCGLGGEPVELAPDQDPRVELAAWMADPENPFFARTLVNRYWKHFFGRGIVDPEDDMRATNPPANPELLDSLAKSFVDSGFDLKGLVRLICNSRTYQLSALPNEYNLKDKQNFSRYYPKRLSAESLYDALHQIAGVPSQMNGLPAGYSALQMRDVSTAPYFMKVFGQPQGETACECERSGDASLAQSLHLLNSQEVQGKISDGRGRAAQLAKDEARPHEDRIKELYLWAYAREPREEELHAAVSYVKREGIEPKISYEDVIWALVNSKEFMFNH